MRDKRVGVCAAFTAERLNRALRFLDEARFGGTITHLFALRAFLPDAIGDAHAAALPALHDALHEELDRLFIKLRLPSYAIAPATWKLRRCGRRSNGSYTRPGGRAGRPADPPVGR